MKKLIFGLFCILFSTYTYAQWYQVEMIVFEHLYFDADGEQWLNNQGLPDISRSIDLVAEQSEEDVAYRIMPSGLHKIGGVYAALKVSSEYRPILHSAWQQPGLTRSRAQYVHIRKYEDGTTSLQPKSRATSHEPRATSIESFAAVDPLVKIDGTIRLRGGHFLYLDIDLAYFFEAMPASLIDSVIIDKNRAAQLSGYTRLKESRKIKLNELHYFDHPLFGVIIWVRRLAKE